MQKMLSVRQVLGGLLSHQCVQGPQDDGVVNLTCDTTVRTCVRAGITFEQQGGHVSITIIPRALSALRRAVKSESLFVDDVGPFFNRVSYGHTATLALEELAQLLGDIIRERMGIVVTMTIDQVTEFVSKVENAA